jgi:hypothetical protein
MILFCKRKRSADKLLEVVALVFVVLLVYDTHLFSSFAFFIFLVCSDLKKACLGLRRED